MSKPKNWLRPILDEAVDEVRNWSVGMRGTSTPGRIEMTKTQRALSRRFADARASAGQITLGPDQRFRRVYMPRLAGEFVRNPDDPEHGFETRDLALRAARAFRHRCWAALGRK